MSTTGKVFIGILFFLQVTYLTVTAALFSQKINWKQNYNRMHEQYKDAISKWTEDRDKLVDLLNNANRNIDNLQHSYNDAKSRNETLAQDNKSKQQQIDSLTLSNTAKDNNITNLSTQVGQQATEITGLQGEIRSKDDQVTALQNDNRNLQAEIIDAQQRLRTAESSLSDLRLDYERTVKEWREKEEVLATLTEAGVDWQAIVGNTAPNLEGKVLNVDEELNLVMLSIGSEDGVKSGYKFYVYRPGVYCGAVKVDRVEKDVCFGRVVKGESRVPIQVGDDATTHLGGTR